MNRTSKRNTVLIATGAVTIAALIGLTGPVAFAAEPASSPSAPASTAPAPTATDGWLRVAHLSPDTKAVDVTVTNLSGGQKLFELDDVAYGTVSPYEHFPAGTYTISMTPWNTKATTKVKP